MTRDTSTACVVVGVDGSEEGLRALDWAVANPTLRGSPLRVLHAYRTATPKGPGHFLHDPEQIRRAGDRAIDGARRYLAASPLNRRVEVVRREGQAVPVLLDELRTGGLLVLGRHGLDRVSDRLQRSTSLACAVRADRPVVLVPPGWVERSAPGGMVVVGVEGGPHDRNALSFAFEEALHRRAVTEIVHLWRGATPDVLLSMMEHGPGDLIDGAVRAVMEDIVRWRAGHPEMVVLESIERAHPIRGMIQRSAYATLLVVSGPGAGDQWRRALGATTGVARGAACPVAVVHGERRDW